MESIYFVLRREQVCLLIQERLPYVFLFSLILEGEWKNNQVYVHKSFGKHWDVFGRVENQQLLLHPEEALFLLESNSIEIKLNDMPMSLQQGHT